MWEAVKELCTFLIRSPIEFFGYMRAMLSSGTDESYTRGAGFTSLYFYLLWATFKISQGVAIKDVDIPPMLALFLSALYGFGEWMRHKGAQNANQDPGVVQDPPNT
jgi:hypothetical protein